MTSLVDGLRRRGSEEVLFPLGGRGCVLVGDVVAFVDRWRAEHVSWRGQLVRVGNLESAALALFLCAWDGWVSAIQLGVRDVGDDGVRMEESTGTSALPDRTRWLVPTSGTSGRERRWVTHDFESLAREVKRDLGVGKALVWGLLYDLHRFAGIQVLFQAVLGGSALAIATKRESAMIAFREAGVNALSATPSQWRGLLQSGGLGQRDLQFVTLGGEIADAKLLNALKTRFPRARVTHVYASTELGVGFSVKDGRAGFPTAYLGKCWRLDDDGCLWGRLSETAAWVDTGDLVKRVGDRCFFRGRADGMINVGGEKVAPESVEAVVLGVPGVRMAWARGKASGVLGEVVELLVVPDGSVAEEVLREEVLDSCVHQLERHAVPAVVRLVDHLPLTGAGKLCRGKG